MKINAIERFDVHNLLLTFDLHVHICSLNQIFSFLLFVILLVRHDF